MLGKKAGNGGVMQIGRVSPGVNLRPSFRNPWEMNSFGQAGVRQTEDELTSGILGTSTSPVDPNMLRQRLFQMMALIGYGYMYENEAVQRREEEKKALARTQNLALPADGMAA